MTNGKFIGRTDFGIFEENYTSARGSGGFTPWLPPELGVNNKTRASRKGKRPDMNADGERRERLTQAAWMAVANEWPHGENWEKREEAAYAAWCDACEANDTVDQQYIV